MKTITLNDIRIKSWGVDVANRKVHAEYSVLVDTGEIHRDGTSIFWETLPEQTTDPDGNPVPLPDNWHQLPAQHGQTLTDLTAALRSGLLHLVNE